MLSRTARPHSWRHCRSHRFDGLLWWDRRLVLNRYRSAVPGHCCGACPVLRIQSETVQQAILDPSRQRRSALRPKLHVQDAPRLPLRQLTCPGHRRPDRCSCRPGPPPRPVFLIHSPRSTGRGFPFSCATVSFRFQQCQYIPSDPHFRAGSGRYRLWLPLPRRFYAGIRWDPCPVFLQLCPYCFQRQRHSG